MPRFQKTIAAAQTDSSLVTAIAGRKIRVTSLYVDTGASTTVTLNSKGAGAGTAISPAFDESTTLDQNTEGHFETLTGEALTATTSAGASSFVVGTYQIIYP